MLEMAETIQIPEGVTGAAESNRREIRSTKTTDTKMKKKTRKCNNLIKSGI